jgi:hypothetical protein
MKKIARSLRRDLRRAFNALALAHHGEMLPRSTKYRVLAGCTSRKAPPPRIAQVPVPGARRRIAFALDGQSHGDMLRYAIDTAARFDADIDIITNLGASDAQAVIVHELGAATDGWNLVQVGDDLLTGIADYARRNPDVLFVMSSAAGALTERYIEAAPTRGIIRVPWLVISDDSRAA